MIDMARFYAAELLLGLEHLHELKVAIHPHHIIIYCSCILAIDLICGYEARECIIRRTRSFAFI
jgi:hypothetical protein